MSPKPRSKPRSWRAPTRCPVVVDLWADWCGPCKALTPILEQVIDETDGQVVLAKVDVDANPRLAESFKVQGIPAVFAIHDGKIVGQFIGAQPEAAGARLHRVAAAQRRRAAGRRPHGGRRRGGAAAGARPPCPATPRPSSPWPSCTWPRAAPTRRSPPWPRSPRRPRPAGSPPWPAPAPLRTTRPTATARSPTSRPRSRRLLPQVKADDDARQQYLDLLELMGPDDPRTAEYRKRLSRQLF